MRRTNGGNIVVVHKWRVLHRWKTSSTFPVPVADASALVRMMHSRSEEELLTEWRSAGTQILHKKMGEDTESIDMTMLTKFCSYVILKCRPEGVDCSCELFADMSECAHELAIRQLEYHANLLAPRIDPERDMDSTVP